MAAVQEFIDSGWTRDATYGLVASLTMVWFVRERTSPWRRTYDWWPSYWLVTALLLLTMGVARAGALGDWIAEYGREQARSEGWYETRRQVQVIAVVSVTVVWFVAVLLSVWRIPPRRRRYLPNVIVLSTLVAFAGVRVISLHQIDAVLYRRGIGDVRFVAVIELGLMVLVAATTLSAKVPSGTREDADRTQAPTVRRSGGNVEQSRDLEPPRDAGNTHQTAVPTDRVNRPA